MLTVGYQSEKHAWGKHSGWETLFGLEKLKKIVEICIRPPLSRRVFVSSRCQDRYPRQ